jgi:Fe-Mn family superoxide dismutase
MFKLPDLPYGYDALQPTVSAETMHLHHDKHHAKYVDTMNQILKDAPAPASLEDVIVKAAREGRRSCSTTPPRLGTTPSSGWP